MNWLRFARDKGRSGAKLRRANHRRLQAYRPRLDVLEERLPPGDMVLGGLLAGWWAGPAPLAGPFIAQTDSLLAPEGRRSVARDVSPWTEATQPAAQPRRGDRMSASLSSFQGSGEPRLSDTQGWRSGLPSPAPSGLADEWTDGTDTNPARRQHVALEFSDAALHGGSRSADVGSAFTSLTPSQPFWVTPTLPAAEGTRQDLRSPASLLESVADIESPPAGPQSAVHALFNLEVKAEATFPTNWFTVADRTQNTGRRVNLPLPDLTTHRSDFEDTQVLNTLDGFNMQPRLSIPFDGPIDVNSVSSSTVFQISLGDTLNHHDHGGQVVGINQVVWDVASTTLHVESNDLLDQHTRYALIVTNGIHDTHGDPVQATHEFRHFRQTVHGEYKHELLDAIHAARRIGIAERDIVTASVFTTESATAVLEKIRDQIHASAPEPADFNLGTDGSRTVFSLDRVNSIAWIQQTGDRPPSFAPPTNLDLSLLRDYYPGAVGELAFGKYVSPDYEVHPGEYIPPVGTRTGTPVVQAMNDIYFNLVLPSGPKPDGGWPVAIFGIGGNNDKNVSMTWVAASMANQGIATIIINSVGNGLGPLGTLTVNQMGGDPVTFLAGGRAINQQQNDNHVFGTNEGFLATEPWTLIKGRDGIRQTAVDFMQLVRVIDVGMDVDGGGSSDLDASRVYYFGWSQGANAGSPFLAVEPDVRAGDLSNPGYSYISKAGRLNPGNRASGIGTALATRVPPLLNSPGITSIDGVTVNAPNFNENLPLRNGVPLHIRLADGTDEVIQSPVINTVAGAMAIQEFFDNGEWAAQAGNPVAYAPHLRKDPLAGVPAKSVVVQFAKGDQTATDPNVTAVIRAGDLADRATFYRHDLAFAENPALPRNPHGFMVGSNPTMIAPAFRDIALAAQAQIATFFASYGTEIIQPPGVPVEFFEVPIQGALPEDLNFIPSA